MAPKHPGRTRPADVTVPPYLNTFVRRLSQALGWRGGFLYCAKGGIVGQSPENRWAAHDPRRFAVDHLFSEMLSKFSSGKTTAEQEKRTWDKFWEAEELCKIGNSFFLHRDPIHFSTSVVGVWLIL